MRKCVKSRLMEFLTEHKLLNPQQFGFGKWIYLAKPRQDWTIWESGWTRMFYHRILKFKFIFFSLYNNNLPLKDSVIKHDNNRSNNNCNCNNNQVKNSCVKYLGVHVWVRILTETNEQSTLLVIFAKLHINWKSRKVSRI